MTIKRLDLPEEVREKICNCLSGNGWSLNHESGFWVHAECGKPSFLVAVLECDECGKSFVPDKYKTVKMSFLGAMCRECEENE
jgi:hypothetical protein